MNKPNFFIVGAPKCGTTAMNDYLAQHPAIFMATKEVHYFGHDLKVVSRPAEAEYLALFRNAKDESIIGEASVWYLFSKTAAAEIKAFTPQAKILIMLRNPVAVMHALHSQHLYDGNEDVLDFETAVSLDAERKSGRRLPNAVDFIELPPYLDAVLFYEQVKRYIDTFGREQVHVVFYDDFKADTEKTVMETLRFLGVAAQQKPKYQTVNSNKQIRFFALHRLIKKPAPILKKVARILVPSKKIRHAVMSYILKQNIFEKKRAELSPNLYVKLKKQVTEDVVQLGKLLNRDLSGWLQ